MNPLSVSVDKDVCIGCGLCTSVCDEVFELGDDGKSQVIEGADTSLPCVEDAADQCPASAISVE
ncbi:MAG: ferredoxin [Candidatus Undinarchaeales archaeon]|nr:ferredoxin [Candidatus Undinarchaeales archaeon]MDP7491387.1 ferredoxin [Candidatus Undinarchaeales archaeon]